MVASKTSGPVRMGDRSWPWQRWVDCVEISIATNIIHKRANSTCVENYYSDRLLVTQAASIVMFQPLRYRHDIALSSVRSLGGLTPDAPHLISVSMQKKPPVVFGG